MFRLLFVVCMACASVSIFAICSVRAQVLISARVLSIEGQVEIRRQPDDRPQFQKIAFKVKDELKTGDMIVTGKGGRLVLGLVDGSQAIVAPQTTVVIEDLSQSPRTLFRVIRGKTRIHIEKLGGQPNPYRVNTPTAVIAVRGTLFDVLVEEAETQVYLHEGEVTVSNPVAPDEAVFLVAGQMTRVWAKGFPKPPKPFKIGQNDRVFKLGKSGRTSVMVSTERKRDIFQGSVRIDTGDPGPDLGRGAPSPGGSGPVADPRRRP